MYGKNIAVQYIRSLGILIKYYSFIIKNIPFNDKYVWKDIIVFTKAFINGIKGQLGKYT
jgi:hypothetical protein